MPAAYRQHEAERAALGIPCCQATFAADRRPDRAVEETCRPAKEAFLLNLLNPRPRRCVDDAAEGQGRIPGRSRSAKRGPQPAGLQRSGPPNCWSTMVGGYNVHPLIELLDDA